MDLISRGNEYPTTQVRETVNANRKSVIDGAAIGLPFYKWTATKLRGRELASIPPISDDQGFTKVGGSNSIDVWSPTGSNSLDGFGSRGGSTQAAQNHTSSSTSVRLSAPKGRPLYEVLGMRPYSPPTDVPRFLSPPWTRRSLPSARLASLHMEGPIPPWADCPPIDMDDVPNASLHPPPFLRMKTPAEVIRGMIEGGTEKTSMGGLIPLNTSIDTPSAYGH
eukprot:GHVO01004536.1.p1 GENE.GHVO01004536.1~~GHVO01004536.1.p1  ORF type:complete len:222 (-),score=39.15 GHVO01004536.1:100-765(-)